MKPGQRRSFSLLGAALLGLLFAGTFMLVACGEDGVTPDCPALSLYNVKYVYGPLPEAGPEASADEIADAEAQRDAILEQRAVIDKERAAAVEAGCLTDLGDAQHE